MAHSCHAPHHAAAVLHERAPGPISDLVPVSRHGRDLGVNASDISPPGNPQRILLITVSNKRWTTGSSLTQTPHQYVNEFIPPSSFIDRTRGVFSFTRSSDLYSSPHTPSECRDVASVINDRVFILFSCFDTGGSCIKEARSWLGL